MSKSSKKDKKGCGLLGFAIFWTLFSSIFLVLGIKSTYDAIHRSQWPEVDCTVTHFRVSTRSSDDPPFQPKARFTYEWQGQSYTGDQVWAKKKGEEDYEDLAELIEQHHAGELDRCYVNPDDPSEAVLLAKGDDLWGGIIFALVGGLFVAIGIGLIFTDRMAKKQESAALSSKKTKNNDAPLTILVPFFSLFGLAGLGIFFFLVVPSAKKYIDAQGWVETPAKVIWSRVRSHSSDDGTTYSVDIFYRYNFDGRVYKSNNEGIMSGSSSSGRSSKAAKVKEHPPGKEITCYVNPEKPWQAMLSRELGWSALFALFPLPFIAVGVGGLWYTLRKHAREKGASNQSSPYRKKSRNIRHRVALRDAGGAGESSASRPDPLTFSPASSRRKSFLGVLVFALFWNGLVSVFVTIAVKSWLRDDPEWFLTIFIIPFVLVGLGALIYCFTRFLAMFSPAASLLLKPGAVPLGGQATVTWKLKGNADRIQHYAIYLVGEEEAQYQRGTDTVTAHETFYEEELLETKDPRKIRRGTVEIDLSKQRDIMPSWKGAHNRIKWSLQVRGKLSLWPDIKDRYDIDVLPLDISTPS
ncbi:DUF3592 domain-containing protein [Verrucomicrobiaceae bacterium 5K15]|uniref:DUF3592 domain-containing protein n=1 Tax=Oceaniferula flava TaxID=2800421 RepID=A0AAE2SED3_9BACT|nr:DUF3592 domain-containing protein [Oceaniferula flavus]MBK1856219.1 DUF3592 domain-containing protein [Oceaniferula flavus]MBM1137526.1 DUF3592 domain-containing protein [Oceaniferula flavus]